MKIFGVGLSKTGTSSLARALEILGYRTKDYLGIETYVRGDLNSIYSKVIEENDAFTDTPIPSFYQELDKEYPGSKFILTVRETTGWLKSCKKQFTQKLDAKQNEAHKSLFRDLYGCSVFDEKLFKNGYDKFVNSVRDYFKDRPNDLLVLDIIGGDGWDKICPFLNKPVPDIPFPKANVTQIRWMNIQDIVAIARQAGKEILPLYFAKHGVKNNFQQIRSRGISFFSSILAGSPFSIGNNPQDRAAKRAFKRIKDGLNTISPTVPVISPLNPDVSYSVRRKLNHFWLVGPLDNEEAFVTGGKNFTISIALIEDNKPYMGVVYAPLADIIFYGTLGKGSFCSESGAKPRRLGRPDKDSGGGIFEVQNNGSSTLNGLIRNAENHESTALLICLIAAGKSVPKKKIEKSMEWQTAAAHAIAAAAGLKLKVCDTKEELTYNKETFTNSCITIE